MGKVIRISNVIPIGDRKRRKPTKEDFFRPKGKGPEPPKGA